MTNRTTFTLSIRLGNDAMQTADDIAQALYDVASSMDGIYSQLDADAGSDIYDRNGNRVGSWKIKQA